MRWERFIKNCAFAVILFLLVNALEAAKLPGTEPVREYIAFAFTSDWDYRTALDQARTGVQRLATFTGRLRRQPAETGLSPEPEGPEAGGAEASGASVGNEAAGASGDAGVTRALRQQPAPVPPAEAARETWTTAGESRLAWPVRGWISEEFGQRKHPISRLMGPHEGIDIGAGSGTPVGAAAAGKVTGAFRSLTSGLTVEVTHEGGLTTRYLHLSAIKVRLGETVRAGTVIGLVGSTGVSTGPHLHFEVRRDGQPVDPLPLLPH